MLFPLFKSAFIGGFVGFTMTLVLSHPTALAVGAGAATGTLLSEIFRRRK